MHRLIVFTAATQQYLDENRELIDPLDCYFKLEFFRNNCLKSKKNVLDIYYKWLIKDLRIFESID